MSKTRVYELAQQMGVDNKEIVARLHAAGVMVKNHMAVIEEADAKKLQATVASAKDASKEEVRVNVGVIRRRKVVEAVAEEPPAEVAAPPVVEELKPEPAVVAPPVEPAPPAVVAAPAEIEAPPAPVVEPEPPKPEAPLEKPAAPVVEEKATATRAKILGRVEIVMTPTGRGREVQPDRRQAGRPGVPSDRPAPSRPSDRPAPARTPERVAPAAPVEAPGAADKRGRKGKETPAQEAARGGKKGPVPSKKKEGAKKAELMERRERVMAPRSISCLPTSISRSVVLPMPFRPTRPMRSVS